MSYIVVGSVFRVAHGARVDGKRTTTGVCVGGVSLYGVEKGRVHDIVLHLSAKRAARRALSPHTKRTFSLFDDHRHYIAYSRIYLVRACAPPVCACAYTCTYVCVRNASENAYAWENLPLCIFKLAGAGVMKPPSQISRTRFARRENPFARQCMVG